MTKHALTFVKQTIRKTDSNVHWQNTANHNVLGRRRRLKASALMKLCNTHSTKRGQERDILPHRHSNNYATEQRKQRIVEHQSTQCGAGRNAETTQRAWDQHRHRTQPNDKMVNPRAHLVKDTLVCHTMNHNRRNSTLRLP